MVAASLGGASVAERLDWLSPEPTPAGYTEADIATLRAFGIKPQPKPRVTAAARKKGPPP
jgi:hypothetical protein